VIVKTHTEVDRANGYIAYTVSLDGQEMWRKHVTLGNKRLAQAAARDQDRIAQTLTTKENE